MTITLPEPQLPTPCLTVSLSLHWPGLPVFLQGFKNIPKFVLLLLGGKNREFLHPIWIPSALKSVSALCRHSPPRVDTVHILEKRPPCRDTSTLWRHSPLLYLVFMFCTFNLVETCPPCVDKSTLWRHVHLVQTQSTLWRHVHLVEDSPPCGDTVNLV